MPLETCRGRRLLTASVVRRFWTRQSVLGLHAEPHLVLLVFVPASLSGPAPAPPSPASHRRSDDSRIPLLLNSSKHHFQTAAAGRGCGGREGGMEGGRGEGEGEGGLDLQRRPMQRAQNVSFDGAPVQTGQEDLLERHDSGCPH